MLPNENYLKKLRRGEIAGNIALAMCAVTALAFIACFSAGKALNSEPLWKLSIYICVPFAVIFCAAAAFCNIRYSNAADKIIENYVRDVLIENAALMHPERDSLTFFFSLDKNRAEMSVNGYKEKIVFDFSPFGKLSAMRKMAVSNAVTTRLNVTFMRLLERGGKYKNVNYTLRNGKKTKKPAFIIKDGAPDVHAQRIYYQKG